MKLFVFFCCLVSANVVRSQSVILQGRIKAGSDLENINVLNITGKVNTITDAQGRFSIQVQLYDTLVFSSLVYKPLQITVNNQMLTSKICEVQLVDAVNELNEVVLGKILSGKLGDDIKQVEGKEPINFYDVGIPGYTGKIATQSERRLSEASSFTSGSSNGFGLGAAMQFTPIINAISGRTKMLKARVLHEAKDDLLHRIKTTLAPDFFKFFPLEMDLRTEFLYFCESDPKFMERCNQKNDIELLEFLKEKLVQYKKNLNEKPD
ncbi:carboxypeptidase-like regulatory domain-containing protein [Gaetbulibacter sp. M240]|uniref:carboxypeptidase-like regulatory domain-containing protein n=1 Tax=Gaetbulibacter sp. M240 TaxID=3126511 RepID=UPI00374E420B